MLDEIVKSRWRIEERASVPFGIGGDHPLAGRLQQGGHLAVALVVALARLVQRRLAVLVAQVRIGAVPKQNLFGLSNNRTVANRKRQLPVDSIPIWRLEKEVQPRNRKRIDPDTNHTSNIP